ncbi:hypothetical protein CLV60_11649 [Dyadobacter jiangsuensis]|uniref:Uncharacterized protein n=1 Tax=Dyadobacter jiangsuensis TaxID=1591085 RepID=A0A2P8FP47_9BACT|nr:hypothetical protein CLV60_11649 [Dyadobacter jiangsuensis]
MTEHLKTILAITFCAIVGLILIYAVYCEVTGVEL